MDMSNFEPSRMLKSLRNEMDNLLDRFVERPLGVITGQAIPALDVSESDTEITVKVDLPGIDEKDIDVSIAGDVLTIRGQKKEDHEERGKTYHVVERTAGSFTRSVRLPVAVRVDMIRATFNKGVLEVVLPKKEIAQARKIEVKTEHPC